MLEKTIIQYQRAFNGLVERLKGNDTVLAAMVFGSVITGDLWDKSDLDLFVIVNEKIPDIKNITKLTNPKHSKLKILMKINNQP